MERLTALLALCIGIGQPMAAQDQKPKQLTRVLHVSGSASWDYRFVSNTLRHDRTLTYQGYLLTATKEFEQSASQGTPPLTALPREHIDLFDYDVVLLSDVRPEQFGANDGERKAFQRDLNAFVLRGGGLGMALGPRMHPARFADQPLARLLPKPAERTVEKTPEFRVVTPAGDLHPILSVGQDRAESLDLWRRAAKLSVAPVRLESGWQMLLEGVAERPDSEPAEERRPLLATKAHGRGRILVVAAEDTWRLRSSHGPAAYDRLWRQAVNWLHPSR